MRSDWQGEKPITTMQLSQEQKRKQRLRSIAIAWTLVGIAVLFFIVTIVRLGENVANRPL